MTLPDGALLRYRRLHLGIHPLRIGLLIERGLLCRLLLPTPSLSTSQGTAATIGPNTASGSSTVISDVSDVALDADSASTGTAGTSSASRLAAATESLTAAAEPSAQAFASPADEDLADEAFAQLQAWLDGRLTRFDLPLAPLPGTALQQQIRERIAAIPRGETRRYGELGPPRCVARVCSGNPLPLLLPCHRVIPAGGSLAAPGRYQGGTQLKRWLLQAESAG